MKLKRSVSYFLVIALILFLANFFSVQLTGYSVFHPIKSIFFQGGSLGPSAGTMQVFFEDFESRSGTDFQSHYKFNDIAFDNFTTGNSRGAYIVKNERGKEAVLDYYKNYQTNKLISKEPYFMPNISFDIVTPWSNPLGTYLFYQDQSNYYFFLVGDAVGRMACPGSCLKGSLVKVSNGVATTIGNDIALSPVHAPGIPISYNISTFKDSAGLHFVIYKGVENSTMFKGGKFAKAYTKEFIDPNPLWNSGKIGFVGGNKSGASSVDNIRIQTAGITCSGTGTRSCPIQRGVCSKATESCIGGLWSGCSLNDMRSLPNFLENERTMDKSCDGLDNDCNGYVDESQICQEAKTSAIATWAFVDSQIVSGTRYVGVVAYHSSGIQKVDFSVDNGPVTSVTSETKNPETGEYEYVFVLDTTKLTDQAKHNISATVYPKNGIPDKLDDLTIWVYQNPQFNSWYVDQVIGSDANPGTKAAPFKTFNKAASMSRGGDTIFLGDGDYILNSQNFTKHDKYITITKWPGKKPVVRGVRAGKADGVFLTSFIKIEGLEFNLSHLTGYKNYPIFRDYGNRDIWIKGNYIYGPRDSSVFYGTGFMFDGSKWVTLEDNVAHDINDFFNYGDNVATYEAIRSANAIVRNNTLYEITQDFFQTMGKRMLITGNRLDYPHSKLSKIMSQNKEPFNLSVNKTLTYYTFGNKWVRGQHDNISRYIKITFPDISKNSPDPSRAKASEIASLLNSNPTFRSNAIAMDESGHLVIHSLVTSYEAHHFVNGSANYVLGFKENSLANRAIGSGQHSDLVQTWFITEDLVFRNNEGHDLAQAILIEDDSTSRNKSKKDLAFVNNLFESNQINLWYVRFCQGKGNTIRTNILVEHNTFWGTASTFEIKGCSTVKNFVIRNNIIGPGRAEGEKTYMAGSYGGYNIYDSYVQGSPSLSEISSTSILTNPGHKKPSPTDFFIDVATLTGEVYNNSDVDFGYSGDFHLSPTSVARDKGYKSPSNISYDLEWNPRDSKPDVGAYEFIASGNNPPSIAPISNKVVMESEVLKFKVTANDPDGDRLVYFMNYSSGVTVPYSSFVKFLSLGSLNGEFFWRPQSSDVGTHQFTFSVSDGKAKASTTINITVLPKRWCTPGQKGNCLLQKGVCAGSKQTCSASGIWPGCSAADY
ncbi:DUF1565 domain-containing protein, partial [Candidatus Pacearchaeota archaeon]